MATKPATVGIKFVGDEKDLVKASKSSQKSLKDLEKQLNSADKQSKDTKKSFKSLSEEMEKGAKATNKWGAAFTTARLGPAGMVVAAGAATVALGKFVNSVGGGLDGLAKFARATDSSVETLTGLTHAFDQQNVSQTKMFKAMETGLKNVGRPTAEVNDALATMGVTLAEVQGLGGDQLMLKLGAAMSKIEDPAKRAAAGSAIFGRGQLEVQKLLAGGIETLDKHIAKATELGQVYSMDAAEGVEKFNDELDILSKTFTGVGNQLGVWLKGVAGDVLGWINKSVTGLNELADAWTMRFGSAIEKEEVRLRNMYATARDIVKVNKEMGNSVEGMSEQVETARIVLDEFQKHHDLTRTTLVDTVSVVDAASEGLENLGNSAGDTSEATVTLEGAVAKLVHKMKEKKALEEFNAEVEQLALDALAAEQAIGAFNVPLPTMQERLEATNRKFMEFDGTVKEVDTDLGQLTLTADGLPTSFKKTEDAFKASTKAAEEYSGSINQLLKISATAGQSAGGIGGGLLSAAAGATSYTTEGGFGFDAGSFATGASALGQQYISEQNPGSGADTGAAIGTVIGGVVGTIVPVIGTAIGAAVGGMAGSFLGSMVGGDEQPLVAISSHGLGTFDQTRGTFGQRSTIGTSDISQISIGGRDGGAREEWMQPAVDAMVALDNRIAASMDAGQLSQAQANVSTFANETNAENFDLNTNVLLRTTAIFDAFGEQISGTFQRLTENADLSTAELLELSNTLLTLSDMLEAGTVLEELPTEFSELVLKLDEMGIAGESLGQTYDRLARQVTVFENGLKLLGVSFEGDVLEASDAITKLSGGINAFAEKSEFFFNEFFSEQERNAFATSLAVAEVESFTLAMADLDLEVDTSREGFRDFVTGLDLSTEAGQVAYAASLDAADAVDLLADASEEAAAALEAEELRLAQILEDKLEQERIAAQAIIDAEIAAANALIEAAAAQESAAVETAAAARDQARSAQVARIQSGYTAAEGGARITSRVTGSVLGGELGGTLTEALRLDASHIQAGIDRTIATLESEGIHRGRPRRDAPSGFSQRNSQTVAVVEMEKYLKGITDQLAAIAKLDTEFDGLGEERFSLMKQFESLFDGTDLTELERILGFKNFEDAWQQIMERAGESMADGVGQITAPVLAAIDPLVTAVTSVTEPIATAANTVAAVIPPIVATIEPLQQVAEQFDVDSISDYLNSLLLGNLSALTPQEQVSLAQSNFEDMIAKARSGAFVDPGDLTAAHGAYVGELRSHFGVGPEFNAAFEQATNQLIDVSQLLAGEDTTAVQLDQLSALRELVAIMGDIRAGGNGVGVVGGSL